MSLPVATLAGTGTTDSLGRRRWMAEWPGRGQVKNRAQCFFTRLERLREGFEREGYRVEVREGEP